MKLKRIARLTGVLVGPTLPLSGSELSTPPLKGTHPCDSRKRCVQAAAAASEAT